MHLAIRNKIMDHVKRIETLFPLHPAQQVSKNSVSMDTLEKPANNACGFNFGGAHRGGGNHAALRVNFDPVLPQVGWIGHRAIGQQDGSMNEYFDRLIKMIRQIPLERFHRTAWQCHHQFDAKRQVSLGE